MDKAWEEVSGCVVLSSGAAKTKENQDVAGEAPASALPLGQTTPHIWAVGGGKGGVGKSLISANFAWILARRGRRVLAIDLDLGGANLHTCLGVNPPKLGIGDWALGKVDHIRQVMVTTPQPGLLHVSGSQDPLEIMTLMLHRCDELVKQLRELDLDDIIIDLGAGTHPLTLNFFNAADSGILSILPEPTSVENAYRFIRALFYQRLMSVDIAPGIKEVIQAAVDTKNVIGLRAPADIFAVVDRLDARAAKLLREAVAEFHPKIVINQVRSQVDIDVGKAICSVCRRYFGLQLHYAGYVDYDNSVWRAIRSRRPAVAEFPRSALASRMERLTNALIGEEKVLYP